MHEIVLDTETTGIDAGKGDRIVEIGAIEIVDQISTGRTFHVLINPEREVPEEAFRVHGHSTASLRGKPIFQAIAFDFLKFIGEDRLVIHNAEFDVRFLNSELARLGRPPILGQRVVDTLALARRKFPGSSNSLDALCDRYRINRSHRVRHGALLDAELLVEVYIELTGGRQRSLEFVTEPKKSPRINAVELVSLVRPQPLPSRLTKAELLAHGLAAIKLGDAALWRKHGHPGSGAQAVA